MSIPNILTIIRLCMMPIFLVVYFLPVPTAKIWAMIILAFAFLTDVLDGYIARKFNQVSNLGKILDPLADKAMQITVYICLAFSNHALIWLVAVVFSKDIIMGIGAFLLYRQNIVISANWFGKVSCFVSIICSLVLLLPVNPPLPALAVQLIAAVIVFVNVIAFISYAITFSHKISK